VSYTLTRGQPPDWTEFSRRIDGSLLTSFVEAAAAALVGLGHPPERVKTERFGATGG
jgi:hypothetical protein